MKKLFILGIFLIYPLQAQQNPPIPFSPPTFSGTVLPSLCNNGSLFYNVGTYMWYGCGPVNNWVLLAPGSSGGGAPTGPAGGALNGTYPNPGCVPATNSTNGCGKPDGTSVTISGSGTYSAATQNPISGANPGALVTAATGTTLATPLAAVVGTGQSLSTSGTGTINANQLNSVAIGGALLTDNGGGNTACLRDTLFPGGYLVCSDGSGNLFVSTQGTEGTINFNINGTQINFTAAGLSMGSGTTITYPISAPVGSVPCFKAGGVIGWASNTSGVIGTTCN